MDVDKIIDEVKEGQTSAILKESGAIKSEMPEIEPTKSQNSAIERLGEDVAEQVIKWKLEEELSYTKIAARLQEQGHKDIDVTLVHSFFNKYNKLKDKVMEDNGVLRRRMIRRTFKHENNIDNMIDVLINQLDTIRNSTEIDEIERTQALTQLIKTAMDTMKCDSTILGATQNRESSGKVNLTQINITNRIGKEKEKLRSELLRANFKREPTKTAEFVKEEEPEDVIEVEAEVIESTEDSEDLFKDKPDKDEN